MHFVCLFFRLLVLQKLCSRSCFKFLNISQAIIQIRQSFKDVTVRHVLPDSETEGLPLTVIDSTS